MDFSDRFIAILSGTRQSGNSIKKVADAIRKNGLIPETMFPYRKSMSWLNYYGYTQTPNTRLITSKFRAMGQEFLERFPINYEFVNGTMKEFNEARKYNPLKVFLFAYNGISNGVYTRTTLGFNHLAENHNADQIFDSYDPYIKTMASNFLFGPYATRYIINFKKGKTLIEVKKKMDNTKLHQIYQELLLREPDEFAKPYLKFDEEYVRKELGKSKERKEIIKWINRLRKIKLI